MTKIKEQILNHERNSQVVFDEAKHTYTVNGEKYKGVTGWIGEFCKPFNADEIAENLAENNPNWWHLTKEEILEQWNDAREYGNYVDKLIEDCVNRNEEVSEPELEQFKRCLKENNIEPVMAQWVIFNEDFKRASAIDFVGIMDGKVVIFDVKSMEKDIDYSAYGGATMSEPIGLPDSRFYKFCLQIGIYEKWLKEKYDVDVADTHYVLRIRPDFYELIPVMRVDKEIKALEEFTEKIDGK